MGFRLQRQKEVGREGPRRRQGYRRNGQIFVRWRERFGSSDTNEEIYLAIVQHLPSQSPHHYTLLVTSKFPNASERDPKQTILTVSRSLTMTPDSATNLQQFLEAYQQSGAFYLLPAVITDGVPEVMPELGLLKRHSSVKDAASVSEHDIEVMALRKCGYVANSAS
jgi:hypothetical protein